jgi:UDPglucose 6-dehydrogenase
MKEVEPLYKVGIIGYGVVGKGVHRVLDDYIQTIYDPADWGNDLISLDKTKFIGLDMAVVAVPTNTAEDGKSCDTKQVQSTLEWLEEINFKGVVMIKSTLPPSELIRFESNHPNLRIVFSPEYMGESKYFTPYWKYPDPLDMRTHTWQIFGGKREDTRVCLEIFKRKLSVDTQYFQTDLVTASLAKYIENSFFAMKVTFVNEWYDIAKNYKVDWNELREMWLADPRINRNHTLVFPKSRGYSGKCFPKDVKAIIYDSEACGYEPTLMKSVDTVNDKIRSK